MTNTQSQNRALDHEGRYNAMSLPVTSRVHPITIAVPQSDLDDLERRLAATRWPDEPSDSAWTYGTDRGYLQELVRYWRSGFDWRAQERALGRFKHYRAQIGAHQLHFIHELGVGPDPFPLVITHGWPSSVAEMHKIIGPLTDPARFGGDPKDAFDVVVPSLPGFGFSTTPEGLGRVPVEDLWALLMSDCGYDRFGAQGGDFGAYVTTALGRFYPERVIGIHISSVDLIHPDPRPPQETLTAAECDYLQRYDRWKDEEGGYAHIQSTRPQTLAYALNDSPAGLAGWIVEKFRAWSDCGGDVESRFTKDELLTTIAIYWFTQTINSSMRMYCDRRNDRERWYLRPGERIEVPTGVAMFPGETELVVPREWAERFYNVRRWTDMPSGGHFAALEEPELLVDDIRAFFRPWRG